MRHLSRPLALVAVAALVAATVASAQGYPQTREGFWIGFGFGYGSLGFSCPSCISDREGGLSGYLKLGGTISPHFLIGGETNGWTKTIDGITVTTGNVSLAAYYYPRPEGGLFLRGGVGAATYQEESADGSTGFGFVIGVGYDVRLAPNVSLTPVFNFTWGSLGDIESPPDIVPDVKHNLLQLAVGVTFH